MANDVTLVLRLIPNGRRGDRLYCTLIATPAPAPDGKTTRPKIALEDWPLKAFDAIFGSGDVEQLDIFIDRSTTKLVAKPVSKHSNADWLSERVASAWRGIVPDADHWEKLRGSIGRSLSSDNLANGLPASDGASAGKDATDTDLNADGSYLPPPADATKPLTIKAVLPVKHGDLALLLELDRAARVYELLAAGTPKSIFASPSLPSPQDIKTPAEAIKAEKLKQLNAAIKATQTERGKAAKEECKAAARIQIVEDEAAVTNKNSAQQRWETAAASHVVGAWAQALPAPEEDSFKKKEQEEGAEADDKLQQVLQAYQAIVSSPAWSRIFGFAFDVYIDLAGAALPKSVSAGDWQLPGDGPDVKRKIWTYLDAEGWPATKSNASVLKDALFRMGTDCAAEDALPRFDAVTLDVRQAAEAAARPLDTGLNRMFQTAGLSLIDRLRAEDVRTQIARTSGEKGNLEIGLHADDLLVGRRLDVGILKEGNIEWRALGARTVTYGFRELNKRAESDFAAIEGKIIDDLLGEPDGAKTSTSERILRTRTVEQAIVNAAARLAPSHDAAAGANDREVFVEEAFATWDGAPMGVHSGDRPTESKVNEAKGAQFPFLQQQRLPAKGFSPTDLAPPLRYGDSYRFGMRAVFLGGKSKTVGAAATLYNCDVQEFTYPNDPTSDTHQWPLRRFVRQEALGAPVILLPASMLDRPPGEMEFENAQSAILRSVPADYKESHELPNTVNGRRYTKARERVTGDEIVRIFVPPATAMIEMLRAGKFDCEETRSKVLKGGPVGMAYGVPTPMRRPAVPDTPEGGFPIALVEEKRAFDLEPTRRSLLVGWSKAPSDKESPAVRGASIFIEPDALDARVKKKIGAKARKFTPRPYYPDPHATRLILRLRRRSDGSYVGPACEVQIYDSASIYPDAMPVALVIRKPKAGDPATSRWSEPKIVQYDGVSFKSEKGPRVQRVDLALAQGDDFDLEAFYLPDSDALATEFALVETMGAFENEVGPKDEKGNRAAAVKSAGKRHVTTGFYPVPDDDDLRKLVERLEAHLIGSVLSSAAPTGGASSKNEAETAAQSKLGPPIEDLAAFAAIRVAYAVNRPLRSPLFHRTMPDGPTKPGISIQRITQVDADATSTRVAWLDLIAKLSVLPDAIGKKDYLLRGRIDFDRTTTSAIEIVAACVSPRDPLFDDPARKRPLKARVAGAWPQKTGVLDVDKPAMSTAPRRVAAEVIDVYGFEDIDPKTGRVTLKRSEVILLRVDNIAGPGAGAMTMPAPKDDANKNPDATLAIDGSIELGLAHLAALLGKSVDRPDVKGALFSASQLHTFPDGKARELELRLRAVSRFAVDFETAPRWTSSNDPAVPAVRLRQPLNVLEQWNESAPSPDDVMARPAVTLDDSPICKVWLPSSRRPDKCAPLAPVPVIRLVAGKDGGKATVTRRSGVRIYLERGWFSSGEGERLGLILPTSDQKGGQTTFITDDEFGPLGPFVSRWGGDPIREDFAPLVTRLEPKHFGHSGETDDGNNPADPYFVKNVEVPVQIPAPPGTQDPLTVLLKADLLTYAPRFDVDREQWFVDLDLCAPETPNLFVRLGLVRFQKNAMRSDLQVSEPVTVWTQLLPERELSAKVTEQKGQLEINVCVAGNVHKDVRTPTLPTGADATSIAGTRQPAVNFRLTHESDVGGVMRRILLAQANVGIKKIAEADGRWEFTFEVPRKDLDALGKGNVYVFAEEIETFMPANYVSEPVSAISMFDAQKLIRSGPRFSARLGIPLPPAA